MIYGYVEPFYPQEATNPLEKSEHEICPLFREDLSGQAHPGEDLQKFCCNDSGGGTLQGHGLR